MKPERTAIIESASQDLSSDDRNIASLDIGEAIVTSNFARYALPVKIPFFDDVVKAKKKGITRTSLILGKFGEKVEKFVKIVRKCVNFFHKSNIK